MAIGDIYRIFVEYGGKNGGKVRYTVEVGQMQLGVIVLDSITSQYENKSEFIKQQYYPIKDWIEAGLQKPSYIDIKSSQTYNFAEILRAGQYTGQLTMRDVHDLFAFIESYVSRIEQN